MYAGEQITVNNIFCRVVDNRLFVVGFCTSFFGGDEGRTDVTQIRAHGLSGQDRVASSDGARQQQRAVEPLADFLNQYQR